MNDPEIFVVPPRDPDPVDLGKTVRRALRGALALVVLAVGVGLLDIVDSPLASDVHIVGMVAMAIVLVIAIVFGVSVERFAQRELRRRSFIEAERDALAEEIAMQAEELHAQNEELLEVHEQLRLASDSAADANRAKSDFLAQMSHELRTPLNAIIGFTNVLRKNRRGTLGRDDRLYLDRIGANGEHLLGLINQVLDLAKIESRRVEILLAPTHVTELASDVVRQLEGTVPDGVELKLVGRSDVQPVSSDPDRLRQVLINLVGNALKFTRSGSVTVAIVTDASARPVRLDVEDTGVGMTPEQMIHIFEPFEQGGREIAREYGGTGLGLAISRALCDAMGHGLSVQSERGRGSVFSIALAAREELRLAS